MSDLDFSDHHSQMEASQFKALFSFIKDGIDKETQLLQEGETLEHFPEEPSASAQEIEFLLQRELDGDVVSGLTPAEEIAQLEREIALVEKKVAIREKHFGVLEDEEMALDIKLQLSKDQYATSEVQHYPSAL